MSKQPNSLSEPRGQQIFIGFPPPLLGAEPVRLPVLACGAGLLALNLPGGLAADADPLNPQGAPLVAGALREQLAAGKPELARLGVKAVQSLFNLEPEISGAALYAVNREAVEFWRNAYGSGLLRLRFLLICERAAHLPDTIDCDLPIARHRDGGRMLVSHKSGKKTTTRFRRLAFAKMSKNKPNTLFDKELWEASVTYLRPHQIRLHAHEVGLRVCGESLYAQVPSFYLSELKGLKRRLPGEEPLRSGPMVHLSTVEPVAPTALATPVEPVAPTALATPVEPVAPPALVELSAPAASVEPPALVIPVVPSALATPVEPPALAVAAGAAPVPDEPSPSSGPCDSLAGSSGTQKPAPEFNALHWPIVAPLPRPLALASDLLFATDCKSGAA